MNDSAWRLAENSDQGSLTFAARRRDVADKDSHKEWDEPWSTDDRFYLAQVLLMEGHGENLSSGHLSVWLRARASGSHRPATAVLHGSFWERPVRRLHRLGDQFMSDSLDGRTIAAELVPMATDWKEIGDMKSDRTTPGELEASASAVGDPAGRIRTSSARGSYRASIRGGDSGQPRAEPTLYLGLSDDSGAGCTCSHLRSARTGRCCTPLEVPPT